MFFHFVQGHDAFFVFLHPHLDIFIFAQGYNVLSFFVHPHFVIFIMLGTNVFRREVVPL
jgi:hypothetical protein